MAQIFAGADRHQIDPEVLEAFKSLSDEFWIFAEFTIARNIDWFILHPHPAGSLALIVVEQKRSVYPLAGDMNNSWKQLTNEGWRDLVLSGPYRNYYWQSVDAANALRVWLWNNQRRYRNSVEDLPQEAFKVWPDLLILSPDGVNHQLPLQPPNGFGKFIYSLDECIRHIASWNSRQLNLVPLTEAELLQLAEALGLERIWPPAGAAGASREQLLALVRRVEDDLQQLRQLIETLAPAGQPARPVAAPPPRLSVAPPPVLAPAPVPAPPVAATLAEPAWELVFGWIEDYLRQHEREQPVRFAELGNGLKSRHGLDPRAQYGLTLTDIMRRAEQAGRVRVSYLDKIAYASLPGGPVHQPGEPVAAPSPLEKLGREWIPEAIRIIAAAEGAVEGRTVQPASLLKLLREALVAQGGPALSNKEAGALLKDEFTRVGYVATVEHNGGFDPLTGQPVTVEAYRLNRDNPAVTYFLQAGPTDLPADLEVRPLDDSRSAVAAPA